MASLMHSDAVKRLESFFGRIGKILGHESRRVAFSIYAMGLLGEGERKSVEPMACLDSIEPETADAAHQRLLHFASVAPWSDRAVRREAASYALDAMTAREPVEAWIVDDTGFLKQGTHSVGVQRQYTGSAGKITNCQLGVSLSVATRTEHVPIDFELYLPKCWSEDGARRREARIPDEVVFKTKPELALDMIRRAIADGVHKGVLLADSAYGTSSAFRAELRALGLQFIVGVDPRSTVWRIEEDEWQSDAPISVRDLAWALREDGGFRRCTWRKGTKQDLTAKFVMVRVLAAHDDGTLPRDREPLWLLIEWRDGEDEPANYFLSSLPRRISRKKLIRIAMQRWRTERVYEDLKGELGLDHFEGRRFPGWHHHISVALCCYAFIVAERVRHFPPSARNSLQADSLSRAA
jgi:SRSO17 transposase